jgi:hypothetical protein
MKLLLKLVLVFGMLAMFAGMSSADPACRGIDRREARQHLRIHRGYENGQLTRGERMRLNAGQMRVRGMERRMKADGRLDIRERVRLHRALDRQSRRIYRLKHNGRSI